MKSLTYLLTLTLALSASAQLKHGEIVVVPAVITSGDGPQTFLLDSNFTYEVVTVGFTITTTPDGSWRQPFLQVAYGGVRVADAVTTFIQAPATREDWTLQSCAEPKRIDYKLVDQVGAILVPAGGRLTLYLNGANPSDVFQNVNAVCIRYKSK